MARTVYGGTPADFLINSATVNDTGGSPHTVAVLVANTALDVYDAATGGTHITDLLDASGSAETQVTSDATGRLPAFQGPDGYQGDLYVKDPNSTARWLVTRVGLPSLTTSAATTSAVGDAAAAGTGTTAAHADHTHGRESFGAVTGQTSYGASSANGTATTPARSDHVHGTPSLTSSAASTSAVGDSAAAGTGTTAAKADHVHGREAFAAPSSSAIGDAAAAGTATTVSRSDHTHGRESAAAPGSSAVGDAAAAGSAATVARSDHKHGREGFGSVTAETSYGTSSANGSATTLARSDHGHGNPTHGASDHSTIKLSDLAAASAAYAVYSTSSDPGSPAAAQVWYRSDLGQFRGYDAGQSLAIALGAGFLLGPMVNTGYWYPLCGFSTTGGTAAVTTTSGTEYAMPLICGFNGTLSGIAVDVATGVAATTLRAGVRSDSGNGTPGATVLYDGGTVASTTSSQVRTWTPSLALTAGRIYWVTVTPQGGTPSINGQSIAHPLIGVTGATPSHADMTTGCPGAYAASATGQGALPSSYSITSVVAGALKILVKFSAASR